MANLMLCSRALVIKLCFGDDEAEFKALTGAGTVSADLTKLDTPIMSASSDIEVAAGNKFDLPYSTDPDTYPFHIQKTAALLAGYYSWLTYAKGKGECPPNLLKAKEEADAALERIRGNKQGTGTLKPAPSRFSGLIVDQSMGGTLDRMTVASYMRLR